MFTLFKRFIREEDGQDFAEYALILGAIGVVAIAVIARYRNELIAAFEAGIEALRMPLSTSGLVFKLSKPLIAYTQTKNPESL
ncbi:MAG: hypothetical protein DPW18_12395 [Chloroflexi bacterium]|nr:hypothetical protein [Chloroflexota bacterium]MDL1941725.1 hypothetical protein [Chloroflexi bacterium CFX2]